MCNKFCSIDEVLKQKSCKFRILNAYVGVGYYLTADSGKVDSKTLRNFFDAVFYCCQSSPEAKLLGTAKPKC